VAKVVGDALDGLVLHMRVCCGITLEVKQLRLE
jgi:hypothetical protein